LYKLKRQVAARRARLWWDNPPCRAVPNKHTYFTILQIVESAFRRSKGWKTLSIRRQETIISLTLTASAWH